jgi:hypothetical protein
MITPREIEIFQSCRARWKLAKENGEIGEEEDDYFFALRKTIFQMYSWLQEKDRFITDRQVRERWDKNWWAASMDEGVLEQDQILDKAADGWMMLENYWSEKYIGEPHLTPVGINFEFSTYQKDIHYRIHADLVLADKDGRFYYRQFGGKKTDWNMYNSLATKLEILGLAQVLGHPPARKSHIDLLSEKTKISEKTLNITPAYLRSSMNILDNISMALKNRAIYTSPSRSCSDCPYTGKCWL